MSTNPDEEYLRQAIDFAVESVALSGGPFGALIVRGGEVLALGRNRVAEHHDPTAHAEVVAIREACKRIGDFQLSGCTLYSSCEPCPMCLAAAYWARIDRIVFGAGRLDAARAGFDDERLYRELSKPYDARELPITQTLEDEAIRPFRAWLDNPGRVPY